MRPLAVLRNHIWILTTDCVDGIGPRCWRADGKPLRIRRRQFGHLATTVHAGSQTHAYACICLCWRCKSCVHTHPAARADRPDTLVEVASDVAGESNRRITHRDAPVAGCRAPWHAAQPRRLVGVQARARTGGGRRVCSPVCSCRTRAARAAAGPDLRRARARRIRGHQRRVRCIP